MMCVVMVYGVIDPCAQYVTATVHYLAPFTWTTLPACNR